MLAAMPLMLVPLIAFNLYAFGVGTTTEGDPWALALFSTEMLSGALFSLRAGDLLVIGGVAVLFAEILKATRTGSATLTDHLLSMLVFVAFLVEFLVVPAAAHSVFLILTVIAFIDVVAGFSISITAARRDVGFTRD